MGKEREGAEEGEEEWGQQGFCESLSSRAKVTPASELFGRVCAQTSANRRIILKP